MFIPFANFQTISQTQPTPGLTALDYGRWVMTRTTGFVNQSAQWSNTGTSGWTLATTPNSYAYIGLDFSPELGLYVAVSGNISTDNIMTSTNSVTWTSRSKSTEGGFGSITWCPPWGVFLAQSNVVDGGGSILEGVVIWKSSNGIDWVEAFTASGWTTPGGGGTIYQGVFATTSFGNEWLSCYRVGTSGSKNTHILYSSDGVTFATYSIADRITGITNFVYNRTYNLWIANDSVGSTTTTTSFAITNTASVASGWTAFTVTRSPANALALGLVANNDGRNGATAASMNIVTNQTFATGTNPIRYSTTGQSGTWTASTLASAVYDFQRAGYSRALNQFLVTRRNNAAVFTSTNGITWTSRTSAGTGTVACVFAEGVRTTGYRLGAGIT